MEGKRVVFSVLIMSLVMVQIQVQSWTCCPTDAARDMYFECAYSGKDPTDCALLSDCKLDIWGDCPPGYDHGVLENSGDAISEYCKLGCASSMCMCGAMTTLKNSDANKIVNGAVEKCVKACSILCTA
ncbi:hypothetical protein AALP_AA3G076400 [Arabis alpina]|uniref:Acidic protein n=1 Tax=Arabis alpina TaxID=50452 RepID=A0A087H7Q5_ARAAL|nr:hypothetical protein AALP_AA3G076400 [Arabis alpina]